MMKRKRLRYKGLLGGIAAVLIMGAALTFALLFNSHPSEQAVTALTVTTEHIFYLKDSSIYHTYPDQLRPQVLVSDFAPGQGLLAPIFLSGDGKRLFYPLGDKDKADLYIYSFEEEQEVHHKLASKASLFTTNNDSSKMYYQSGNDLYAGNMDQFELIATKVTHYFATDEGDRILYLTTDQALYYKAWGQEARMLDEELALRYVSFDLNTIYYRKEGTLYLIKDCNRIHEIYTAEFPRDIPRLSCVYENGDCYFTDYPALYFYSHSEGVTKLICKNVSTISYALDNSRLYPHLISYAGSNDPIIQYNDKNGDGFLCRGADILKKITGAYINATIQQDGKALYYVATPEALADAGDLYHVAIDGSFVSESKLCASGVSVYGKYYMGDTFVYFKNVDYNVADMYIDEKIIDSKVYTWAFSWIDQLTAPNTFLYLKNTRDYYNSKVESYYTMDTLMLYQEGVTTEISDNVTDYILIEDEIIYLSVDDPDSDQGTLHLYRMNGEDLVIDTGVNALIRPCSFRDYNRAIDPAYTEYYLYYGDYE